MQKTWYLTFNLNNYVSCGVYARIGIGTERGQITAECPFSSCSSSSTSHFWSRWALSALVWEIDDIVNIALV